MSEDLPDAAEMDVARAVVEQLTAASVAGVHLRGLGDFVGEEFGGGETCLVFSTRYWRMFTEQLLSHEAIASLPPGTYVVVLQDDGAVLARFGVGDKWRAAVKGTART